LLKLFKKKSAPIVPTLAININMSSNIGGFNKVDKIISFQFGILDIILLDKDIRIFDTETALRK